MGLFGGTARRGLAVRLVREGVPEGTGHVIAGINYPGGKDNTAELVEDLVVVDVQQARRHTEMFLDGGQGNLHDLALALFGPSLPEATERIDEMSRLAEFIKNQRGG